MFLKIIIVWFVVCSTLGVHAQAINDSTTDFPGISNFKLLDVKQQKTVSIRANTKAFSLFVFLSPECPLSQNYTKTVNSIYDKFHQRVNVFGIIPGNAYATSEVADFAKKYKVDFKLLIDQRQKLTHYLRASVTPEAILIDNKGSLVYTGAIDNWVQALGKKRLKVTEHYVQDAIEQSMLSKVPEIKRTIAIGCKINDF